MTAGRGTTRRALTSSVLLGLVATVGTALLAGVHALTRDRIAEQERLMVQRQLNQVLPPDDYDNSPYADTLLVSDAEFFRQAEPVTVYRARRQGEPVAVVMNHAAPDGYNGAIRLLTAIRVDGSISGVRVVSHRETPGSGRPHRSRPQRLDSQLRWAFAGRPAVSGLGRAQGRRGFRSVHRRHDHATGRGHGRAAGAGVSSAARGGPVPPERCVTARGSVTA